MGRNDGDIDLTIVERFSSLRADSDCQPNLQRGLALLRERHAMSNGRRRRVLIGSALIATCLPIAAFPATRAFAERWVSACVEETAAVRAILLGPASGRNPSSAYVEPDERRMAPDFALTATSGEGVKLSDFRGKVVLLNFWATGCTPCDQEIPWFIEFQQANRRRGLAVLGVSMDKGGWTSVKPYIDKKRVNYPVMIGNDEVAGLFGGLRTQPLTLVIDRFGRIAAIHAGACRKDEYESDIKAVLGERRGE